MSEPKNQNQKKSEDIHEEQTLLPSRVTGLQNFRQNDKIEAKHYRPQRVTYVNFDGLFRYCFSSQIKKKSFVDDCFFFYVVKTASHTLLPRRLWHSVQHHTVEGFSWKLIFNFLDYISKKRFLCLCKNENDSKPLE